MATSYSKEQDDFVMYNDENETFSKTNATFIFPFDVGGSAASAAIISVFFVIGVVGNILTIHVIRSTPKLRNNFMTLIVSLSVSDLISCCISWIWLYRRTWGFDWFDWPSFLCRFNWAADTMTNYATALHIFFFAALRYITICHSSQFTINSFPRIKVWICFIWIISFATGFVPVYSFMIVKKINRTSGLPDSRWASCGLDMEKFESYELYQKIVFPLMIIGPSIAVIIFSILISLKVTSATNFSSAISLRRRRDRQAVLQLTLIVASFLIGYIPYIAYDLWGMKTLPFTIYHQQLDYWFANAQYYCTRLSECLNPIFYNLGSARMRNATIEHLRQTFSYRRRSSTMTTISLRTTREARK